MLSSTTLAPALSNSAREGGVLAHTPVDRHGRIRAGEVLAAEAGENAQKRTSELHCRYYKATAPLLRVLPSARELLARVAALGLQVVLATSAPEDELSILRELLDSEDIVSTITSSDDVETAKPEPAIVEIARRRAGVSASRAVFVGDSVWDAKASVRAGVPIVGGPQRWNPTPTSAKVRHHA